MASRYRITFEFMDQRHTITTDRGIWVARDGFWLDSNMKYAAGSDVKYWIPPHRVLFIECERINDE